MPEVHELQETTGWLILFLVRKNNLVYAMLRLAAGLLTVDVDLDIRRNHASSLDLSTHSSLTDKALTRLEKSFLLDL